MILCKTISSLASDFKASLAVLGYVSSLFSTLTSSPMDNSFLYHSINTYIYLSVCQHVAEDLEKNKRDKKRIFRPVGFNIKPIK